MQSLEEKISETVMVLEANNDIMESLSDFYVKLMTSADMDAVLRQNCSDDVREFAGEIVNLRHNISMELRRAHVLAKITGDRKSLVSLQLRSSFDTRIVADNIIGTAASSRSGL